jgi:hypothetical protein
VDHHVPGPGNKYGPDRAVWSYSAPKPTDFYSFNISGAMRLPNGNTLICSGAPGIVFEVMPENKVVWQYNLPSFAAAEGRGRGAANGRNVFRAYRYAADFPGLASKQLVSGKTLEEFIK